MVCCYAGTLSAQDYDDPQNMPVDPQNTNCAQHILEFETAAKTLELMKQTKWHLEQEIKTTRTSGLMNAFFGSCDFKTGVLMVEFDQQKHIYLNIPVAMWEQLKATDDIDGFYYKHIKKLPELP